MPGPVGGVIKLFMGSTLTGTCEVGVDDPIKGTLQATTVCGKLACAESEVEYC